MDMSRMNVYQEKLEKERRGLLEEIKKREMPEDFGGDVDHFEEKTDEVEETANRLAEVQTFKNRIGEIDSALIKIAHGTYGVCEKCGGTIEEKKLDADPGARTCIACS